MLQLFHTPSVPIPKGFLIRELIYSLIHPPFSLIDTPEWIADNEDAFDEELGALSRSIYPGTFRPPTLEDPEIDDYIIGVFGEQRFNNAIKNVAPNYFAAEQTWRNQNDPEQFTFSEFVVNEIRNGTPLAEAKQLARTAGVKFNLKADTAEKEVENLYKESVALPDARKNIIGSDKYFKAGLPDPKLKYGTKTNYKLGTIDARTIPNAPKYFEDRQQEELAKLQKTYGPAGPQSSAAAGIVGVDTIIENELKNIPAGRTPFFDEVKRRENLKGKTLK